MENAMDKLIVFINLINFCPHLPPSFFYEQTFPPIFESFHKNRAQSWPHFVNFLPIHRCRSSLEFLQPILFRLGRQEVRQDHLFCYRFCWYTSRYNSQWSYLFYLLFLSIFPLFLDFHSAICYPLNSHFHGPSFFALRAWRVTFTSATFICQEAKSKCKMPCLECPLSS